MFIASDEREKPLRKYIVMKALTICVCILFALNILLLLISYKKPFVLSGKAAEGCPYYFEDPREYWSPIGDVLACGEYLYLMYDNLHILACYDLEGNYLHSYSVEMINNGKPHLFSKEDVLYLKAKGHDFYSFRDGVFLEYTEFNTPQYEDLEENLFVWERTWRDGPYQLRGASVWLVEEETEKEIIHRPLWLVYFQGEGITHWVIHMFCLATLAWLYFGYWKK